MDNNNDFFEQEDALEFDARTENEILEMKIAAEFGGTSYKNREIPPLILNQFLQSVYEFEKFFAANPGTRTVFEALGVPELPDPDLLSEDELESIIEDIVRDAKDHGITLHFDVPVENYVRFLFIRDYFFHLDIGPEMPVSFFMDVTYSEILNHDKIEIEQCIGSFFENLEIMDIKESNGYFYPFEPDSPDPFALEEKLLSELNDFFNKQKNISLHSYKQQSLEIYSTKAEAVYLTDFTIFKKSGGVERIKEKVRFELDYRNDWYINNFFLRGITG